LYITDNPSNLRRVVQHEHLKAEAAKHPVSCRLQRSRWLPMPLDFHESDASFRQKHKAVGHSVETWACELGADAARRFHSPHQFLLYCFLSHDDFLSQWWYNRHK
jgi:hypothetical protein